MSFRYVAMPTETADRFRQSGVDDFRNPVRRLTADADEGYFCRHCLAQPGKGHDVLLASWNVEPPKGHFWQPSPIFLCAEPCERFGWPIAMCLQSASVLCGTPPSEGE
jgi:hypothetical protein